MTKTLTLTDIDPGYLNHAALETHWQAISRHLGSETIDGPVQQVYLLRLNLLTAELNLRDTTKVRDYVSIPAIAPVTTTDSVTDNLLESLLSHDTTGESRIPVTAKPHQLWAQHKYSVMARSPALYRQLGPALASKSLSAEELLKTIILCKRQAPEWGGLRNAIWHMWGYVKAHSMLTPEGTSLARLFKEIQRLSVQQSCLYLLHSTALGEFAYWCWQLDPANVAPHLDSTDSAC